MLQNEELKDDDLPANTLDHFKELDEVLIMIKEMKSCEEPGFEKDFEKFSEIVSRYQDQPHLLDPSLENILDRLLVVIRNPASSRSTVHAAFKYLYIFCKVRTYKVLVKFLPHELIDLEFALELLEQQDPKEYCNWETRYMLLLWLSILVLNPFHMARLDIYNTTAQQSNEDQSLINHVEHPQKLKMERIFDICKLYTATNDTCSSIAAYLSAKYLIRADIKDIYLEQYFDWVKNQHTANAHNARFGQLAAIAAIFKHGKRADLLPHANKVLSWILSCKYKDSADFLKYKFFIKIIQRIGLIYLKPQVAKWRYKRGMRSLKKNLAQNVESEFEKYSENPNITVPPPDSDTDDDDDEDIIVPDEIEEIIEELLQGLRSGGSDIRWCAAKGIGRVTNRLPKELADDVIGSVIDILSPLEPHEAWHGACLALAELAKRGLLHPQRLTEIVPLLMKALFYDEMKGYMSVGQHIRDSACYMCWAFARAYDPDDLQPFVQRISAGLLTVAVFDREINCRRAASAAFQESVGRLGNFPYGIAISTTTDFYSVGLRQNSYLNISDFIAQYKEYCQPLIDHLVERKVNHWDTAIRELTAKALHKLTFRDPDYMANMVLSTLFQNAVSVDLNMRHGSVLAIGEIVLALSKIERDNPQKRLMSNQTLSEIDELLVKFYKRDVFRGMSGELMKQCCTDFIRNCSLAKIQISGSALLCWQDIIDKCIVNKTAPIRESATAAFAELCKAYYDTQQQEATRQGILSSYLHGADNDLEEHIRMGYISALGVLPYFMISTRLTDILDSLVKHSLTPLQAVIAGEIAPQEHESKRTHLWSEARRDSIKALSNLVETVGFDASNLDSFANEKYFKKVIECLLKALDEYTMDNRGDIGAWVREASMNALYKLLITCPKEILHPAHVHKVMTGFAQQAVEKIDRTRGLAGRLFCKLVHVQPRILHIQRHEDLLTIFPTDDDTILWLFADHTCPLFCQLLRYPEYSKKILLGLSASIGQLTESLMKSTSESLFRYLQDNPSDVPRMCTEIIENFEENLLNERVTYPMLSFLDILMSSGTITTILADTANPFPENIYRLLNLEIKGHKKLYKLVSSVSVYCQLLQVPRLTKRILSKMSIFLGLTHVHIRKTTATKLYEALALYGDNCDIPEDNMDEVLNLLAETDWSLPLLEVRPIRNEFCKLIGIKAPISNVANTTANAIQ